MRLRRWIRCGWQAIAGARVGLRSISCQNVTFAFVSVSVLQTGRAVPGRWQVGKETTSSGGRAVLFLSCFLSSDEIFPCPRSWCTLPRAARVRG
jgi:hypothetical protein